MTASAAHPHRIVLLDGIRGVAAIGVMLYHLEVVFGSGAAFSRCYLFVDLFFLLSGFVMARSCEAGMAQAGGGRRFLIARVRRLWPMIALGVASGAVVVTVMGDPSTLPALVALGLLMIPAIGLNSRLYPLNGPQWSLLLELIANLAHMLILHRLSERLLLLVSAVAAVLLVATIIWFGSNTVGPFSPTWWYALPRVAFPYTLGIWMARRRARDGGRAWLSPQTILLVPAAVLLILPAVPIDPPLGDSLCVIVLFPALLWASTAGTGSVAEPASPGADPLLTIAMARLGDLSFPLYAVHLPILQLTSFLGADGRYQMLAVTVSLLGAACVAKISALLRRKRRTDTTAWHRTRLA